jgi:hypothetical protein
MADRPILFSSPMVKALLAGTKSQTRRIIKPQPPTDVVRHCWFDAPLYGFTRDVDISKDWHVVRLLAYKGDRLWCKETWAPLAALKHNDPGTRALIDNGFYRADCSVQDDEIDRWRPSIFMPRTRSRITLLVDDVKVERLQDISEDDAIAEGVVDMGRRDGEPYSHCHIPGVPSIRVEHDAVPVYSQLWELINGPGSWASNPWIVCYRFRVVLENIDYIGRRAA